MDALSIIRFQKEQGVTYMYALPRKHTRSAHKVRISEDIRWGFMPDGRHKAKEPIFVLTLDMCEDIVFKSVEVPDQLNALPILISGGMDLYFRQEVDNIGYMQLTPLSDEMW